MHAAPNTGPHLILEGGHAMGHEILPDGSIHHFGRVEPGDKRNPTGKGGFGDHPENRNPGRWNSRLSPSFLTNKFLRMTPSRLQDEAQRDDLTVVERMVIRQLLDVAKTDLKPQVRSDLAERVYDRAEGKPVAKIDATVDQAPPPVINLTITDTSKDSSNDA